MNDADRKTVLDTLAGLQQVRDQLDDLAQKLSPVEGFASHHAMLLRLYDDTGYVMKLTRARLEAKQGN